MLTGDGLHLSGKGVAVFVEELLGTVNSGTGTINHILVENIVKLDAQWVT